MKTDRIESGNHEGLKDAKMLAFTTHDRISQVLDLRRESDVLVFLDPRHRRRDCVDSVVPQPVHVQEIRRKK